MDYSNFGDDDNRGFQVTRGNYMKGCHDHYSEAQKYWDFVIKE